MPPSTRLSRADEILMIVIFVLGIDAFSTTIRQEVVRRAKKKISVGSLWVSLDQLAKRDYIRKRTSDTEEKSGGRPRVYYSVTPKGIQALKRTRRFQERLWKSVPVLDTYEA